MPHPTPLWLPYGCLYVNVFRMSPHFSNIKLKIFSRHFFYKILKVNPKKSGFRYRNQNNSKHCLSSTRQSVKDWLRQGINFIIKHNITLHVSNVGKISVHQLTPRGADNLGKWEWYLFLDLLVLWCAQSLLQKMALEAEKCVYICQSQSWRKNLGSEAYS